jgi:hypothetical protein
MTKPLFVLLLTGAIALSGCTGVACRSGAPAAAQGQNLWGGRVYPDIRALEQGSPRMDPDDAACCDGASEAVEHAFDPQCAFACLPGPKQSI